VVVLDDPVVGAPGAALRGLVAAESNARAVVVVAVVAVQDRVTGRPLDNDDAAMAEHRLRGVVEAAGQTIVGGLVAQQNRLITAAQPEAVGAVVRLVLDVGVAGAPGLDAVVVGVRGVVLDEPVAGRDPAVQDADEEAVAAMGDVILVPVVVVGAALDQDARRVPCVHLTFGPVDPQAVGEVVVQEPV